MRRWLLIAAINLAVVVALLELAGSLTFLHRHQHWIYSSRGEVGDTESVKQTGPTQVKQRLILHPIFGFIRKPGISVREFLSPQRISRQFDPNQDLGSLRANNYGFFSNEDFPAQTNANEYSIAIVGGSVAQWFALQGQDELIRIIENSGKIQSVGADAKRIRVMNFAQGGYKQPQQLLVMSYFMSLGQHFDLVINIDGFNEMALGSINLKAGITPAMPSIQHLGGLIQQQYSDDPEKLANHLHASKLRSSLADNQAQLMRQRSGAIWILLSLRQAIDTYRLDQIGRSIEASLGDSTDTWIHVNKTANEVSNLETLADLWIDSSLAMQYLLNSRNIRYLHILQPNQYFGDKIFSDQEMAIAISLKSPYREAIRRGYPLLTAYGETLKENGVEFHDFTTVFDQEPRPVYADNCCHFNALGNIIIANKIATLILD